MTPYYIKDNGRLFGPVKYSKMISAFQKGIFSENAVASNDNKNWVSLIELLYKGNKFDTIKPAEYPIPPKHNVTDYHKNNRYGQKKSEPAAGKGVRNAVSTIFLLIILFAGIAGGYWWFYLRNGNEEAIERNISQFLLQRKGALGVVVVTLQTSNGVPLSKVCGLDIDGDYPVGTAFAIEPKLFVTNCSVVKSLKELVTGEREKIWQYFVKKAAEKSGADTIEQFRAFCSNNAEKIGKLQTAFNYGIAVKNIRIMTGRGNPLGNIVESIQMHPRYTSEQDKKFDIAILNVKETVSGNVFETLSAAGFGKLASGTIIGCPTAEYSGTRVNQSLHIGRLEDVIVGADVRMPEITCNLLTNDYCCGSPVLRRDGKVIAIVSASKTTDAVKDCITISSLEEVHTSVPIKTSNLLR